ncbi:hypothetical protein [Synoicihabitans lomoniglobus]|uniref:Uncharacterized protein n=1 Tax=Synoicihabitans lomoniglobus TaxID=2909285 RepID=A0AAF0CI36_9BACT|nr:hypothetical protein [Opitutaceae bacterium LMO-M01]WED64952.1 hypothetical protein PXH66_21605 [Opitutaceae bacterium LMO-M01]
MRDVPAATDSPTTSGSRTRDFVQRHPARLCFGLVLLLSLAWAGYTGHVWEDYFITYRASKNLAEGNGLVFQIGERLHTFTSPLGVLLPALSHWLAGRGSDMATLWIFRVMGALAFAGAATLVMFTVRHAGGKLLASGTGAMVAAAVAIESKCLDYTTNGMETPFLLFGFAWTLWTLVVRPSRETLHLGASWGLLMWSRPDACIYIAAVALAAVMWRPGIPGEARWTPRFRQMLLAGLVTTVIYAPWLLWAQWYYGTPIPHTMVAKSLYNETDLWRSLTKFVTNLWEHPELLSATFLPPYAPYVEWPAWTRLFAFSLAVIGMSLWLWPRVPWLARVASFTGCVGQFYIVGLVGFAVPWYLPAFTFFEIIALGFVAGWLVTVLRRPVFAMTIKFAVVGALAFLVINSAMAARQLKWQQQLVEWGNRRVIGEWLREHASSPADTVYLEPLGYIGYFSGLKMLDFPGLSSPEVVAAQRALLHRGDPFWWPEVIRVLEPDWLVLRDAERNEIQRRDAELLPRDYTLARTFNVRDQVPPIPGHYYLLADAYFEVYRRVTPKTARDENPLLVRRLELSDWSEVAGWGEAPYQSGRNVVIHAPGHMHTTAGLPGRAAEFHGGFGLFDGSFSDPQRATDGATFRVLGVKIDGSLTTLFARTLDPVNRESDRGEQMFHVRVAQDIVELRLEVDAGPHGINSFDWTYWSDLRWVNLLWPDGYRGTWQPVAGPGITTYGDEVNAP